MQAWFWNLQKESFNERWVGGLTESQFFVHWTKFTDEVRLSKFVICVFSHLQADLLPNKLVVFGPRCFSVAGGALELFMMH